MHPYNPDWHDMSDFVVHFTRPSVGHSDYDNAITILSERVLRAVNPFGIARHWSPDLNTQKAVCFSEVPLHLLERLSQRRGRYGLGFKKQFILARGGGPIWYVENGSQVEIAIRATIQQALATPNPATNLIWRMTPFIDSTGDYPNGAYRFEWEREWRHVGNLNFSETDVAFLIIPEELHGAARGFFQNALQENTGPGYFCPYIDVGWDLDRIRTTLQQH